MNITETKAGEKIPSKKIKSCASWKLEASGIIGLLALVIWCLADSWRKWPDPIVDYGQQLYSIWRLSQGGALYHDFIYSYGPLSVYFNAGLFRVFGPGIMVLAISNLVIYALILSLAYLVFRKAWGRLAAFGTSAVFISVFSFSQLSRIANYNYMTPYSAESVHGMLLALLMILAVVKWQETPSLLLAFAIGFGGGSAAILKPEFMLALGVLGIAAIALRLAQQKSIRPLELILLMAGTILPTLLFTMWFARFETWRTAFIDASQAWWLVVVGNVQNNNLQQWSFSGLDQPRLNLLAEVKSSAHALLYISGIFLGGWILNRPWKMTIRWGLLLTWAIFLWFAPLKNDWLDAGRCLPGLLLLVAILLLSRVRNELRSSDRVRTQTAMALMLVLLAGTMLARMVLLARISHFGFFQAALAAMVVVAFLVAELPQWTGQGGWGAGFTRYALVLLIAAGCFSIAKQSAIVRMDQTEPVGQGRDRFYATIRNLDETGALVNWAAEQLHAAPPEATVLVLPEGTMINYLARRHNLEPALMCGMSEKQFVVKLDQRPPDYIVVISRDLSEFGFGRFGAPGSFGNEIVKWMLPRYTLAGGWGGDPLAREGNPGVEILRRK